MSKSDNTRHQGTGVSRRDDGDGDRGLSRRDKSRNKSKEKRINAALKTKDVLYLNDIEDAL